MQPNYKSRKLERDCTDQTMMRRRFGDATSTALKRRIKELEAVDSVGDLFLGTGKWERLDGNRAGQLSSRLSPNWRLIVQVNSETSVTVISVEDYH